MSKSYQSVARTTDKPLSPTSQINEYTGDCSLEAVPGAVYDASLIGDCQTRQQTNGTFTNCPLDSNNADLLSTIASATSTSETQRHHSKWDYSSYSYIGRSFGVGGDVGLTDQDIASMRTPNWYNYTEKGFITRTKCIYNDSAEYSIEQKSPSTGGNGYPDMFMAKGLLPNSNWTAPLKYMYYAQIAWENKDKVVGLFNGGPRRPENDNGYYFGIAAGAYYRQLNNIQCELDFEPKHFTVHVSMQNNTINVTSRPEPVTGVLNPDHYLRSQAIGSIGLSFIVTSLYTNTVGDAFWRNVRNMHTRKSPLAPVDSFSNDTILEAVADSVSAMMDDALVALNSYLLTSLNTTQPVETLVAMPAVRIGTRKFIIAGMVINVAGLVFALVACFYLARVEVPLFDYNDLGCIALSATRDATGDEAADAWDGDLKSQILGSLLPKLEVDSTGRPVVMVQDRGGVAEK